jgi:hypothetical protein
LHERFIEALRRIFLHPRPHVSISSARALLGWTQSEMNEAVAGWEVELMETPLGRWVWREELMAKALEVWSHEVIEEALGEDAERVLPRAVRLVELRARVPRYQLAALQYLVGRDGTTVSHVFTRELEDVASVVAVEIAARLPGLAAAFEWPVSAPQSPC